MINPGYLNPLTERQKNMCAYSGVFGVMLTITCLVQHLVVTRSMWVTNLMTAGYIIITISFLMLGLLKSFAPWLVAGSAVLAVGMQVVWMKAYSFSMAVTLLFIYHVIILVMLFNDRIPGKLRAKRLAELAEEWEWQGKL